MTLSKKSKKKPCIVSHTELLYLRLLLPDNRTHRTTDFYNFVRVKIIAYYLLKIVTFIALFESIEIYLVIISFINFMATQEKIAKLKKDFR